MKTFFDICYLNHNIVVENTINTCSLIIDNVVVDSHKGIIAKSFALKGYLVTEYKKIEINFAFIEKSSRNCFGFPRCKVWLTADGKKIAVHEFIM